MPALPGRASRAAGGVPRDGRRLASEGGPSAGHPLRASGLCGWVARVPGRRFATARQLRAQVFPNPVDEAACLRVRKATGGGGDLLHPGEQGLLLAPNRLRLRIFGGIALGRRVDDVDLHGFLGLALVVGVLGALVVRVRRSGEQARAREHAVVAGCRCLAGRPRRLPTAGGCTRADLAVEQGCCARFRLLPLPAHRHPMPCKGDGERLDGREQLLLQTHHEQAGGGPGARGAVLEALVPQAAVLVQET